MTSKLQAGSKISKETATTFNCAKNKAVLASIELTKLNEDAAIRQALENLLIEPKDELSNQQQITAPLTREQAEALAFRTDVRRIRIHPRHLVI